MTYGEFLEKELPCEECPIYKAEICNGGPKCYGGEPIDPPCCGFNDDTDLDKWASESERYLAAIEDLEDMQARLLENKRIRAKKRAETTRQMKSYCWEERAEIKGIKKRIKGLENAISLAQCFASAFNATNEMFEQVQGGEEYKARKQVNPELTAKLDELKEQLKTAQDKYKAKRKEFYSKRRNGNGK